MIIIVSACLVLLSFTIPFFGIPRLESDAFSRTLAAAIILAVVGLAAVFIWRLLQHNTPSNLDPGTIGFILGFATIMQRPPFLVLTVALIAFVVGTILGVGRRRRKHARLLSGY